MMDRKKNFFDMVGSLIPGYRGYAEREGRRNCDKILREAISSDLNALEKTLYERIAEAFTEKNRVDAAQLEEIRKRINTLSSKVKFAPHGNSPFFADSQLKEDELLLIYQIDLELVESVKQLSSQVPTATPVELKNILSDNYDIFNKRESLIIQLK